MLAVNNGSEIPLFYLGYTVIAKRLAISLNFGFNESLLLGSEIL